GADPLVRDYVVREVLAAEPRALVEAVLDMAVVERVNPSLAKALTGRADAGGLLRQAEERGLFVTRLPAAGWFEIHSLVRAALVAELTDQAPARLADPPARPPRRSAQPPTTLPPPPPPP